MINKEINEHFLDIINDWNHRFYFTVGGYGSGKSYNVGGIKLILKALQEPNRKILVCRAVFRTIKESCYDLLKEIIFDMGLERYFRFRTSPLEIVCNFNNSRFIFMGLDDPAKLKSVNGVSIIWLEESPEANYDTFLELNGRLRTLNQSMHIIMTNNPVSKTSWTYNHFFKNKGINDKDLYKDRIIKTEDTYYHHSTVDDNKFAPQSYIEQLNELKIHDPDLYRVARLGEFGTLGERVLKNVETLEHDKVIEEMNKIKYPISSAGMDFGFSTSYNALVRVTVDIDTKTLYIHYEYYKKHMTDPNTAIEIKEFAETGELIYGDSAEPKTIAFYQEEGFNMYPCTKFPGSRLQNTKKIQRFKRIVISDKCPNCYEELKDLTFAKDKNGNVIPDKFNIDPHTFSAIWYALDDFEISSLKGDSMFFT